MSGDDDLHGDTLPPADRMRARAIADLVERHIEERYGFKLRDVGDVIEWAKGEKTRRDRIAQGGILTVIGVILVAAWHALVEGIKHFLSMRN